MIKFLLVTVAIILVGLSAYMYMNPKEVPVAKVAKKAEIVKIEKETPSVEKNVPSVKKEVIVPKSSPKIITVDTVNTEDDTGMSGEATLESGEAVEMDIESEERILEIESASDLSDLSDEDNTPMETEKMVF